MHSSGQRDVSAHVYNLLTMHLEQEYHRFSQWMHLLRKIHVLASFKFAAVMVADNSWGLSVYIWVLEIHHEGICVGHWFNR